MSRGPPSDSNRRRRQDLPSISSTYGDSSMAESSRNPNTVFNVEYDCDVSFDCDDCDEAPGVSHQSARLTRSGHRESSAPTTVRTNTERGSASPYARPQQHQSVRPAVGRGGPPQNVSQQRPEPRANDRIDAADPGRPRPPPPTVPPQSPRHPPPQLVHPPAPSGPVPPQPQPPPPPPHQEPRMSEGEFHATRRICPLGRTGTTMCIRPDLCDMLPDMKGMEEISKLLWNIVVKPTVVVEAYSAGVGRLTSLHFCLIGKRGSGKRTATKSACMSCCVDMVTIDSSRYIGGDIEYAIRYACRERPCVVYFDDFDELRRRPVFEDEFSTQILGQSELCNSWDGVWLAFSVETAHSVVDSVVGDLCGLRMAEVRPLIPHEAVALLIDEFLCRDGVVINPPLTDVQWQDLEDAVKDCTPYDLRVFAGTIKLQALSRISLVSLADIFRVPIIGATPGRGTTAAGGNNAPGNPGGVSARAPSASDPLLARRPEGEGDATFTGESGMPARRLEIRWDEDAESAYVVSYSGYSHGYGDGTKQMRIPSAGIRKLR